MVLTHPTIVNGWFREESIEWPGQALALRVKSVLHVEESQFQNLLVFESTDYGNVLVLDGVIQATERDEFAYQEMISHVPLNCHPEPKRVLVVGGGDGGVLREVAKHSGVEKIELVEIDDTVVNLAKKYLPGMAKGFDDPRVVVHITDGFEFLRNTKDKYDVIISDTSDPEGPAEQLFQEGYFRLLRDALTDDGIIAMQASESVWLKLTVLKDLLNRCRSVFPTVGYTTACVPTYTSGQLGLIVCSKTPNQDLTTPLRWAAEEPVETYRYYTRELHKASFVVPTFARSFLK